MRAQSLFRAVQTTRLARVRHSVAAPPSRFGSLTSMQLRELHASLTSEAIDHLDKHGFVVVDRFLQSDLVGETLNDLERIHRGQTLQSDADKFKLSMLGDLQSASAKALDANAVLADAVSAQCADHGAIRAGASRGGGDGRVAEGGD